MQTGASILCKSSRNVHIIQDFSKAQPLLEEALLTILGLVHPETVSTNPGHKNVFGHHLPFCHISVAESSVVEFFLGPMQDNRSFALLVGTIIEHRKLITGKLLQQRASIHEAVLKTCTEGRLLLSQI